MTASSVQDRRPARSVDYAQFIVCVVLVLVGAFLVYDAATLPDSLFDIDPLGPKFFPLVIGSAMLLMSVVLAVAILRGSKAEAEGGEDIDPDAPSDWKTVGLLIVLFVALIVGVEPIGWVIMSTILFAGAATVLGSKHYIRNVVIGVVLALASFYAFYSGLGIPLSPGILDGIL